MIRGEISPEEEALIPIRLRGSNGDEVELQAILDTGFNRFLTLSPTWIEALALPFLTTVPVRLGNKQMDEAAVYEGRIFWNGQWKKVEVQDQESEEPPLLGMAMLRGCFVTMRVAEPEQRPADSGEVLIEPME